MTGLVGVQKGVKGFVEGVRKGQTGEQRRMGIVCDRFPYWGLVAKAGNAVVEWIVWKGAAEQGAEIRSSLGSECK